MGAFREFQRGECAWETVNCLRMKEQNSKRRNPPAPRYHEEATLQECLIPMPKYEQRAPGCRQLDLLKSAYYLHCGSTSQDLRSSL